MIDFGDLKKRFKHARTSTLLHYNLRTRDNQIKSLIVSG